MIDFSKELSFTGTQINYFIICQTKLWYFSKKIQMEHTSDLVSQGKTIQDLTYKRDRKDILIDNKIAIDFIKKGNKIILHDIKKSNKLEKAHYYQLLYYIYYLKKEKGIKEVSGFIDYPLIRKKVKVELIEDKEKELENIFQKINQIITLDKPPEPKKKKYCRKCSYFEFCFGT